jgi:2-polyprenyl-3-methyl-5-hydroxy-6-metoxy-1,4-benzoquinol methylase
VQKKPVEWFNDESFWEQYAPVMFDDAHWAEVPEVADALIRFAGFNSRSETSVPKILDLCCGFGRISAELARRGFSVTGVDITESYLRTAKEEADYENLKIEYIKADVRDFIRPAFFDAIVNLYISFGYFANPEEDRLLLSNAYQSLKPGGIFVMETLGKEIAVRDFVEADWFERAGYTVMTEYEILDSWTLLKNRWILKKDDEVEIEKTFTQRLYAASELRSMLFAAGFTGIEIFGNWDGSPYDIRAAKLIITAKKKSGL